MFPLFMILSAHYIDVPNSRKTNALIMRKRILLRKSRNKKQIFMMHLDPCTLFLHVIVEHHLKVQKLLLLSNETIEL